MIHVVPPSSLLADHSIPTNPSILHTHLLYSFFKATSAFHQPTSLSLLNWIWSQI